MQPFNSLFVCLCKPGDFLIHEDKLSSPSSSSPSSSSPSSSSALFALQELGRSLTSQMQALERQWFSSITMLQRWYKLTLLSSFQSACWRKISASIFILSISWQITIFLVSSLYPNHIYSLTKSIYRCVSSKVVFCLSIILKHVDQFVKNIYMYFLCSLTIHGVGDIALDPWLECIICTLLDGMPPLRTKFTSYTLVSDVQLLPNLSWHSENSAMDSITPFFVSLFAWL